jgi:serine/threonine protein phosphatase PrpC
LKTFSPILGNIKEKSKLIMAEYASTHDVNMSHAVEQMTLREQDYVCQGTSTDPITEEKFQWTMLNDGHGSNDCINFIRSITQERKDGLISCARPIEALAEYIDHTAGIPSWQSSGATCVIAKCFPTRVECISAGDSQFLIFKNGELIYTSKEHNCQNEAERQRLSKKGYSFTTSSSIKLLSETILVPVESGYVEFPDGRQLACTQALGHNSKTGYLPETYEFPLTAGDTYRVVMGSDGLYDMTMLDNAQDVQDLLTKTSQEICDKTVRRWLQEWEAHLPNKEPQKFKYARHDCDDVSVAVIDIVPLLPV